MLNNRTILRHPAGDRDIVMPLLVPSFSSQGFPRFRKTNRSKKTLSLVTQDLEDVGRHITDSILFSAYDLHHRTLDRPERFFKGKRLVFLDSGGYELLKLAGRPGRQADGSAPAAFSEADYRRVLDRLPPDLPFVITSFDWSVRDATIDQQILAAQELFNAFPRFLNDFLLKPPGKKEHLDIRDIIAHVGKLSAFKIVGVTEKELGDDLLARLRTLAALRAAMDAQNVLIPIHVWGGLDPVMSALYFFAGGEILDGLSWLKYAYVNGIGIYEQCYTFFERGIETRQPHARPAMLGDNIAFLNRLRNRLGQFADSGRKDFSVFEYHAKQFKKQYRALCAEIPELKGGA